MKNSNVNSSQYPCMQPRGVKPVHGFTGRSSLIAFIVKIILGIVGGFGLFYVNGSYDLKESMAIKPFEVIVLIVSVILCYVAIASIIRFVKEKINQL